MLSQKCVRLCYLTQLFIKSEETTTNQTDLKKSDITLTSKLATHLTNNLFTQHKKSTHKPFPIYSFMGFSVWTWRPLSTSFEICLTWKNIMDKPHLLITLLFCHTRTLVFPATLLMLNMTNDSFPVSNSIQFQLQFVGVSRTFRPNQMGAKHWNELSPPDMKV